MRDQWGYLAEIDLISPSMVERIAAEATRKGQVIGVRSADLGDDEEDRAPWTRAPSGRPRHPVITGALPSAIRIVLAQRIFVEKTGLPSALLNQIKRLAAFQNPEFYKKQSMRLSTALTPRVIACAEEFPDHIALPRGCLDHLRDLLRESPYLSKTSDLPAIRYSLPRPGPERQLSGRTSRLSVRAARSSWCIVSRYSISGWRNSRCSLGSTAKLLVESAVGSASPTVAWMWPCCRALCGAIR